MMAIEDTFSIAVPPEELERLSDIASIAAYVQDTATRP